MHVRIVNLHFINIYTTTQGQRWHRIHEREHQQNLRVYISHLLDPPRHGRWGKALGILNVSYVWMWVVAQLTGRSVTHSRNMHINAEEKCKTTDSWHTSRQCVPPDTRRIKPLFHIMYCHTRTDLSFLSLMSRNWRGTFPSLEKSGSFVGQAQFKRSSYKNKPRLNYFYKPWFLMLLHYFQFQDDFLVIYFATLILQDQWQQTFRKMNWDWT